MVRMKKVIAIVLLFVYAASIMGVGTKAFYCCNKLKSVSAIFLMDKSSGNDSGKSDGDCCKTKYSFFKVKDNHEAASVSTMPAPQPVLTLLSHFSNLVISDCLYRTIHIPHLSNAPPLLDSRPSYILNCIYRI